MHRHKKGERHKILLPKRIWYILEINFHYNERQIMYRSRASFILVAALLAGCNAAFTSADMSQASVEPAAYSSAAADPITLAEVVTASPDHGQRDGVQLDAQDLGSLMWVADAHSAAPTTSASHAEDSKRAGVQLTAKDLDSLL